MRPVLTDRELALILSKDICRLSTISSNGWPHIVPVGYVYLRGKFCIPMDRRAKKVGNLAKNDNATIVVDDERLEHGVMIECSSKILEGSTAHSEGVHEEGQTLAERRDNCHYRPNAYPKGKLVLEVKTTGPRMSLVIATFHHSQFLCKPSLFLGSGEYCFDGVCCDTWE